MRKKEMIKVGLYPQKFNDVSGANLPCIDILKSVGFYKHVLKKHCEYIGYIEFIPEIINSPDYIGINPKIPNSIELIKLYDEHILVSIELDTDDNYLFVSSLYNIEDSKLQRRLHSGRLKKFTWQPYIYNV